MSVSVIIFDCDGVMFDSRQANVNFYNHILFHFGLPPLTNEDVEFVHMHTVVESLNHIFRGTTCNTIEKVLAINGLSHYFDIVVSSLDVENPKPHPEPVFKILNFFRIEPGECLYVGDSEVDFTVCQASGVPLIAYRNKSLKADFYIDNLLDILKIL
jgi:phosphoglycolate phosphatase-like HAD superfamily hydrolase